MSSTFDRPSPHPVLECADTVEAALKSAADVAVEFMAPGYKRTALVQLTRVEAQLASLRLRVLAVSDDVALEEGARDATALVTHHPRGDAGANRRDLALAQALDRRWKQVGSALAAGEVNLAQARVIVHALEELPAEKFEVLDLGRSSRLFRPAQRTAMIIRDRECRAEGCTIPAAWCEAHHAGRPWSKGGRTDLADAMLLCPWHHHRAHDPRYETRRRPDGDVSFGRRC